MKTLIALSIILFASTFAYSQTQCPENMVCLTREAAVAALQAGDRVKALEAENAVLKQAVADHKDIETTLKVELGKATGELTGSQQMNVRLSSIVDLLLKNVRPKKIGLINL